MTTLGSIGQPTSANWGAPTTGATQRIRLSSDANITAVEVAMTGASIRVIWTARIRLDPAGTVIATGTTVDTTVAGPSTLSLPISASLVKDTDYSLDITGDTDRLGIRATPVVRTGILIAPAAGEQCIISGTVRPTFQLTASLIGSSAPPGPTLTAVANLTTMAVDLTVTGATGAITVTRYVAGASPTGTLVRGTFANGRTVPDTDAPLNTDLVYIARDTVGASPQQAARLDSDQSFISLMSSPSLVAAVTVLADDNQTWRGQSTAHKILASNIPLVTVEPPAYRAGTYRLLLPTVDDWLQLRALNETGGVMLLRSPCQGEYFDTAFIMIDLRLSQPWNAAPPRHRIAELDYQATAPDATPPVDYAWTYADVPGVAATYADLPLQFPTYADLATYVPVPP